MGSCAKRSAQRDISWARLNSVASTARQRRARHSTLNTACSATHYKTKEATYCKSAVNLRFRSAFRAATNQASLLGQSACRFRSEQRPGTGFAPTCCHKQNPRWPSAALGQQGATGAGSALAACRAARHARRAGRGLRRAASTGAAAPG